MNTNSIFEILFSYCEIVFSNFEKGLRAGGNSAQIILGQLSTYLSTKYYVNGFESLRILNRLGTLVLSFYEESRKKQEEFQL